MPKLAQSLAGQDLVFLQNVAELWGLDLEAPDAKQGLVELGNKLPDCELVAEIVEALPVEAQQALQALKSNQSRMPWAQFIRRYGQVREMGPARRDREQPYRNPISTTEMLWYRALIQRTFFDTDDGPKEHAFISDELLPLIPEPAKEEHKPLGRQATPAERKHKIAVNDHILDWVTTLLAALRLGFADDQLQTVSAEWPMSYKTLKSLLRSAHILDEDGIPRPEATRAFLEAPRGAALAQLAETWLYSNTHNDLKLMPGLKSEGAWENDPLQTRRKLLNLLDHVPADTWWGLAAFINDLKAEQPDFQRPAGDYDSWYLRDAQSGEYLRGFEHWEQVDGALVHYLITGPLHWLGIFHLGASDEDGEALSFRYSSWAAKLLNGQAPDIRAKEDSQIHVDSQGAVRVPTNAPRTVRYQVARFCEWLPMKRGDYMYKVTPSSLNRAKEQGLEIKQLLALLNKHASADVPPNLTRALHGWDAHGTQARFEDVLVLRVASPDVMNKLRKSRAARFLGEPLGPTAVIVKQGAWENVMSALTELGYLAERQDEN
ncbi:MAG: hypothetical protein DWQ07_16075 [Chloroflexi bacterium]|nr:MAG: hypothetical protein DWQ07_16075 [Chloroflexota bacterium]MBL1195269.1 hypothetical protein [Chloroflexota bacterium]NOH12553.1 hypothetical protein [Chloroflexota bacterium]